MSEMQSPLYDRLGGILTIAALIDDFIDRVMVDPILNANPIVAEAHERITAAGFKYLVTEFMCEAAGGPQTYSGRSMMDSHSHLKITNKEWLAFVHNLDLSLFHFKVPETEYNELMALAGGLKPDMSIVD